MQQVQLTATGHSAGTGAKAGLAVQARNHYLNNPSRILTLLTCRLHQLLVFAELIHPGA